MFFMLLKLSSELLLVFLGSNSKTNPGNRALLSREAAWKKCEAGTGTGWEPVGKVRSSSYDIQL